MNEDGARDNEAGKSKAVRDLLDGRTGRAKSGRGNVRTAEVVDNDTDDNVDNGDDTLADHDGAGVVTGLSHLRGDGEKAGGTSVGEDEGADGSDGVFKGGGVGELVVGDPDLSISGLGSSVGLVLKTDGDSDSED